jgi:hypothetical protein
MAESTTAPVVSLDLNDDDTEALAEDVANKATIEDKPAAPETADVDGMFYFVVSPLLSMVAQLRLAEEIFRSRLHINLSAHDCIFALGSVSQKSIFEVGFALACLPTFGAPVFAARRKKS